MKIFIDAHIFDQGYEGSRSYLEGLYCSMIKNYASHSYVFGGRDTETLKSVFGAHPNVSYVKYRSTSRLVRLAFEIPWIIYKIRPDCSHFQYVSPLIKLSQEIVTIHDVLFIDYPEYFPRRYRMIRKKLFTRSLQRADMILTVSEYSRGRINCMLPVGKKKVHVIPNGINTRFLEEHSADPTTVMQRYGLDKFILSVGRFEPRKNQLLLLKSFVELTLYSEGYKLVYIGKESLRYVDFVRYLGSLPETIKCFVTILDDIPDSEMPSFYTACKVFVYPSHAEGFGLPPLEAIASNATVLVSDNTALSDFRSLNPVYFDSRNQSTLDEALQKVLSPDFLASKPADLNKYSWDTSAGLFSALLNKKQRQDSASPIDERVKQRIAILGTRGIPSSYGGFETFAEELSAKLAERGGDLYVYGERKDKSIEKYRGVNLKYSDIIKSGNQLRYYYSGLRWASRFADIVINAGTGGALFYPLFKSSSGMLITNMDGLEHKRDKWPFWAKAFLNLSENLSVKLSDFIIADSVEIGKYLARKYPGYVNKIRVISYGAIPLANTSESVLSELGLEKDKYFLVIARLEPENNISMIIDGYVKSKSDCKLVIVGPLLKGRYCQKLLDNRSDMILFTGGIFDKSTVGSLRAFARAYIHGHSVGGTNPSLLESMAQGTLCICHDNVFNREVTDNNQLYFKDRQSLAEALLSLEHLDELTVGRLKSKNLERITGAYSWDIVANQYLALFMER